MGMSSVGSGTLHTTLIGSGLMAPKYAYSGIFLIEATGLILAGYILYRISIREFAASASKPMKVAPAEARPLPEGTAASA